MIAKLYFQLAATNISVHISDETFCCSATVDIFTSKNVQQFIILCFLIPNANFSPCFDHLRSQNEYIRVLHGLVEN